MVAELPVNPLVLPQFQPWGRTVHVPKSPPREGGPLDTISICELVAVWDGEDESWTLRVTLSVPADV